MKTLTENDVVFTIQTTPEWEGPEGFFASGDDEQDAKDCAAIREDMQWNEWAWCIVVVTATFRTPEGYAISGRESLGGCSYESKDDFKAGGYYDEMRAQALEELNGKLASIAKAIA